MLNITDISLLKITKAKPWSICFDYDNKHYLIHGCYEVGEGSWQKLYERELNANGKYKLTHLKTVGFTTDRVAGDYIKKQRGKTIVYNNVDKEFFAYKLTKRGFAVGVMEKKVKKEERHINRIENQINKYKEKIYQLESEIRSLK